MKMQMFLFIFNAKIFLRSFSQSKKNKTITIRKRSALDSFLTVKLQAVFLIREVERTKNTRYTSLIEISIFDLGLCKL